MVRGLMDISCRQNEPDHKGQPQIRAGVASETCFVGTWRNAKRGKAAWQPLLLGNADWQIRLSSAKGGYAYHLVAGELWCWTAL